MANDSSEPTASPSPNVMNALAISFFVLAVLWIFTAISYAISVCIFLFLRSRGHFDRYQQSDPEFGRVYLWGRPPTSMRCSCYLPMGWIFQRFLQNQYRYAPRHGRSHMAKVNRMTTQERRAAIREILSHQTDQDQRTNPDLTKLLEIISSQDIEVQEKAESYESNKCYYDSRNDLDSNSVATGIEVCPICLSGYEDEDDCEQGDSKTGRLKYTAAKCSFRACSHSFHTKCILDWLSRPFCVECPCCRVPLIDEKQVWDMVALQRQTQGPKPITRDSSQKTKPWISPSTPIQTEPTQSASQQSESDQESF